MKVENVIWLFVFLQYGWYWGNTSSEGAEKILSNEPDGSFLVRDSSDSHYIFSLTFKVNAMGRILWNISILIFSA